MNYKYLFTQVANDYCIYQFEYNNVSTVIGRIRGDYSQSNNKSHGYNYDFIINRIEVNTNDYTSIARLAFRRDDNQETTDKNLEILNDWFKKESEGIDVLKIYFPEPKSD
jgi:hypothetical protein